MVDDEKEWKAAFGSVIEFNVSMMEKRLEVIKAGLLDGILTPEEQKDFIKLNAISEALFAEFPPEDEWERLTGLTREELDNMPMGEAMALLKMAKVKENASISSAAIHPQSKHYIQNSKLSNEMIKGDFINSGLIPLIVANKGKDNEVCTMNSLVYEDKNICVPMEFTASDKFIHDAVCSLWAAGNRVIRPSQIYRHMHNLSPKDPVNKSDVEDIVESINKSRRTELIIDYTEQAKLYGLDLDIEKATIRDFLLSAKILSVDAGGMKH